MSNRRRERSSSPPRGPAAYRSGRNAGNQSSPYLSRYDADRRRDDYDSADEHKRRSYARKESKGIDDRLSRDRVRDRSDEETRPQKPVSNTSTNPKGPEPMSRKTSTATNSNAPSKADLVHVHPTQATNAQSSSHGPPTDQPDGQTVDQTDVLRSSLKTLGDRLSDRAALAHQRNVAQKYLDLKNSEYEKFKPQFPKFPAHEERQRKNKQSAEALYQKANGEYEASDVLFTEASGFLASQLAVATQGRAPTVRDGPSMEQYNELLRMVTALQQQQKRDAELLTSQKSKDQKEIAAIRKEQAETLKKIEEEQKVPKLTAKDLESITGHIENYGQDIASLRKDIDSNSSQLSRQSTTSIESRERYDEISKQISNLPKQRSDIAEIRTELEQLSVKLTESQQLQGTTLEAHNKTLNDIDEVRTSVAKIQSNQDGNLQIYDELKSEIKNINAKLEEVERNPPYVSRSAADLPSSPGPVSSATMNGLMQTKVTNFGRDMNLLKSRVKELESSQDANRRDVSKSHVDTEEKLQVENRLDSLEKSLKEMKLQATSTGPKMSPFSTTALELADTKKSIEMFRTQQEENEAATKKRLEVVENQLILQDGILTSTKGELSGLRSQIPPPIPNVQDALGELIQNYNSVADSCATVNKAVNELNNKQEGTAMAIAHLTNRWSSLSSLDLATCMLGQLETLYPNLKNAEGSIAELRKLLMDQTRQIDELKTQTSSLDRRLEDAQSPVQEMRNDLDATKKDLTSLYKSTKAIAEGVKGVRTEVSELDAEQKRQEAEVAEAIGLVHVQIDEMKYQFSTRNGIEVGGSTKVLGKITNNQAPPQTLSRNSSVSASIQSDLTRKRKHPTLVLESSPKANGHSTSRSPLRKRSRKDSEDLNDLERPKKMFDDEDDHL